MDRYALHQGTVQQNGDMVLQPLHQGNDDKQNGHPKPFIPSSRVMMPGRFKTSRFGSYQQTKYDKCIIVALIFANCFLYILAAGALFIGIYLHTYRGSYADLCSDNEWKDGATCLLAVGSFLIILAGIGFVGICTKSSRVIGIYIALLVFLLLGELTAAIYAFARRAYIESRFQACMKDAYQNDYYDPAKEHVTKAWDLFQDRFDCCGVEDSLDYRSNTKAQANPPKSCGGTMADARARQPCFNVIKREVLDNFYMIGGPALGIAVLQIFIIVVSCLLLYSFYKREEYE